MFSSILYHNADSTIILIDIPRSIEIAQVAQGASFSRKLIDTPCSFTIGQGASRKAIDIPRSLETAQDASPPRKLISSKPLEQPYPSVEPKSPKARAKLPAASLQDLLLQKHLHFALTELKTSYHGEWCLPRITSDSSIVQTEKQRREEEEKTSDFLRSEDYPAFGNLEFGILEQNPWRAKSNTLSFGPERMITYVPPNATALLGDINTTLAVFSSYKCKFDRVVLDPPWPNRSARRKKAYGISYSTADIRDLLSAIPLQNHLTDEGLVAVWVTNKDTFREMVVGIGGLFEQWGVYLVEEWIWLKVTSNGEPICELDSLWRKPYEILLVGRRPELGQMNKELGVKRRVIVGVPDLHSRKPNLKEVFGSVGLGGDEKEEGRGLEIFARNLTSGWWGWGDEVLKFQGEEWWVDGDGDGKEG